MCPDCHSWQEKARRKFSAMDIIIVFLVIAVAIAVTATVRAWLVDGYRRIPTDGRRLTEFDLR